MRFTKMHGLGNDYLYVYGEVPANIAELSRRLSDRHFGVGSDGMIYISPSRVADFKMRIFNADGSEAKMCGNGIRCVGKYVFDKAYTPKTSLDIETLSGIKHLELKIQDNVVVAASVDMGTVSVGERLTLCVGGQELVFSPVSVGNPHAVTFVDDADAVPIDAIGPLVERHEAFPGGVNVEFVQAMGPQELRMRVWERGSGITMACGTGACASAAAAVASGFCKPEEPITVHLDGGDLTIVVASDWSVTMIGPATIVYEGEVTCS